MDSIFFDTRGRSKCPFQVFIGGRGVGKTYPTLRNLLFDECMKRIIPTSDEKFLFVRRLAKEIEICSTAMGNPFKSINTDCGSHVEVRYNKNYSTFSEYLDLPNEDGSTVESQEVVLGYGAALSTFAGLRGIDLSEISTVVFDEFVEEKHVRRIRAEGSAFMNMIETIGRNRELKGKPPLKVFLLSNAISLGSEILLEMHAVPVIAGMIARKQNRATVKERGLYIEIIENKAFIQAKQQTALYKLARGTDYEKHSVFNQFLDDNLDMVAKVNINEFKPLFSFNEYTVFQHKSRNEFYIARRQATVPLRFGRSDVDRLRKSWKFTYQMLVVNRLISYDDYATKLVFDEILLS